MTRRAINPKDAIAAGKLPMHLWPATATAYGAIGLLDGAGKYGRNNFRETGVRASVYVGALERHVKAWFEGEECAPDSGVPHLAHALACLAILVDTAAEGKLIDDRNLSHGGWERTVALLTPHVGRIVAQHRRKNPRHFTIRDAKRGRR